MGHGFRGDNWQKLAAIHRLIPGTDKRSTYLLSNGSIQWSNFSGAPAALRRHAADSTHAGTGASSGLQASGASDLCLQTTSPNFAGPTWGITVVSSAVIKPWVMSCQQGHLRQKMTVLQTDVVIMCWHYLLENVWINSWASNRFECTF